MSSQIESKLENLVGELHKTNNLLTELVVDNKHRDSRLDHLESKDEKQDVINKMTSDFMLLNQPKIDKSSEIIEKYEESWKVSKDSQDRNKRIGEHVLTKIAVVLSIAIVTALGVVNLPSVMQESKQTQNK